MAPLNWRDYLELLPADFNCQVNRFSAYVRSPPQALHKLPGLPAGNFQDGKSLEVLGRTEQTVVGVECIAVHTDARYFDLVRTR